ncbi:DUF86 domain-containing protein [Patescibacteria group bacterium]|nr:DUF86 domain-containing protein [Patescibacteria group bacterium]
MKKVPRPYLLHIIGAIEQIGKHIAGFTKNKFIKDVKTQDAVVRQLEIIGEASTRLEINFKKTHPEIPWKKIIGMRNKITHEYWDIDLNIVWHVATKQLSPLKKLLEPVVKKLKN